jgi:hypothetical protein
MSEIPEHDDWVHRVGRRLLLVGVLALVVWLVLLVR